ncbi:MAG: serralysin, partial [Verrucomicrobiota bacterium]
MRKLRKNHSCLPPLLQVARLSLLLGLPVAATSAWAQFSFFSPQAIFGEWGGVTNDNSGVTPDPGGPSHAGFVPNAPLWYTWTAPESGEVTLDTLGSVDSFGQTLDTVLAVYTGPSLSRLIQVAANDDYYPFQHLVVTTQTDPFGAFSGGAGGRRPPGAQSLNNPVLVGYPLPTTGPSILRFNATAGTTYYIAVDSKVAAPLATTGNGRSVSFLSLLGNGSVALNWAFRPSGVLRFASEEYDIPKWVAPLFNTNFTTNFNIGMPQPLYQCTEMENVAGVGYTGGESVHDSYYQYDPEGLLVTVTRVAGSRGRLLVDYATQDGTNALSRNNALSNVNYTAVSGTLVFDDYEMSKTIRIPIGDPLNPSRPFYSSTNNPIANEFPETNSFSGPPNTNFVGFGNVYDRDFSVVLSNPRLDDFESPDVSPPRMDAPLAVATVRILSMAGLGQDPDENWTGDTFPPSTAPGHDVYN